MGDKRPFPAMLWPDPDQGTLNSWTGDRVQDLEPDLHVVRNEDLLSDAPGQVIELVDFLGLDVTPQAVRFAVASASAEQMRPKEKQGMRDEESAEGSRFIGQASSNQWRSELTSDQVELILAHAGTAMERHGYL